MLARSPLAIFPTLTPADHTPHPLHDGARDWPETNCYLDVWIEILHAMGLDPTAAFGFAVGQDFEGDHFTFAKIPLEDLRELYGLEVAELALYDALEVHVAEQTSRGRMVLLEVDGYGLPDTRGVSYRLEHTKTTVAINRIDPDRRSLDYFHGTGLFTLDGADYDAVLATRRTEAALFPYAEFVKFEGATLRPDAVLVTALLRRHLARKPRDNPVLAFRDRLREQATAAAGRDSGFLHKYAFNTARQLGMNFELLGSHLAWLGAEAPRAGLSTSAEACRALSVSAKSFQFQLARAVARKRFDAIEANLDPLAVAYERVFAGLAAV